MNHRAFIASVFWFAAASVTFYALGGEDAIKGWLVAIVVILVAWQAVWSTLSWVERGDPRWWR